MARAIQPPYRFPNCKTALRLLAAAYFLAAEYITNFRELKLKNKKGPLSTALKKDGKLSRKQRLGGFATPGDGIHGGTCPA